jgi:ABC-type dipeptide/oligopeptide/nickel transport system permease component
MPPSTPLPYPALAKPPQMVFPALHHIHLRYPYHFMASLRWIGITFGGLTLAGLLNGSVAIEVVFAWPGIGRLMLQGINQRDFPIIQATVLAAGFFYIAISLIVDILYAYVNPRIRYE